MKKFYLIDGTALIYRAYYAFIRNPLRDKEGNNTSAIYGVANSFLKLLDKYRIERSIISFDLKAPTFRHKISDSYKANRPPAPDELIGQIEPIKEFFSLLAIPEISCAGYEADDVIATLNQKLKENYQVFIVTGDKDFSQIVDERTKLIDPFAEKIIDAGYIKKKYGVTPEQFIDYLAIVGDTADNIPGVKGIGAKGAEKLLNEYHDLDTIYDRVNDMPKSSLKTKLIEGKESAYTSKDLVTIIKDIPLKSQYNIDLDEIITKAEIDSSKLTDLLPFLLKYDLNTIAGKIKQYKSIQNNDDNNFFEIEEKKKKPAEEKTVSSKSLNHKSDFKNAVSEQEFDFFSETVNPVFKHKVIDDEKSIIDLIEKGKDRNDVALSIETYPLTLPTEVNLSHPQQTELVGISFAFSENEGFYIPISDKTSDKSIKAVQHLLETKNIVFHNSKYALLVLEKSGFRLGDNTFDTMLASYLIDASTGKYDLSTCITKDLNIELEIPTELSDRNSKELAKLRLNEDIAPAVVASYSVNKAVAIYNLFTLYKKKLEQENLTELYYNTEIKLLFVLAEMEKTGVTIDTDVLAKLNVLITETINNLSAKIVKMAGEEFNLNSPQQLANILFDKLQLPAGKKTKTGYSTDNSVLEKLAEKYEIADLLIEYRQLTKLRSTYIESLPTLINEKTGRIHSSFNQMVTSTGRLSSTNPNLQNIPIRTDLGKQIRKAFIAKDKDHIILAADYSQIELRILGILSKDRNLVNAFNNKQDIHAQTAGLILNKPISMVTQDERRMAKSINFGIIYGMGPQKLSKEINITLQEAKDFIEEYFKKFPRIREYIQAQVNKAKKYGYAETIMGRKLKLPNIYSGHPKYQTEAERIAVNMPLQGSAADIIKMAMINIKRELNRHKEDKEFTADMLIQVHDELVFEVSLKHLDFVKEIIVREMKYALPEKYRIIIPLGVDAGTGDNWYDAHL